jgi:hypothetical protein
MVRIRGWLIHSCSKRSTTSKNAKGDPVYGALTPFKARVEKSTALVKGPDGEDVTASHVLVTDTLILPEDLVWFPSVNDEPADDITNALGGRTVVAIASASNKSGRQKLWQVFF